MFETCLKHDDGCHQRVRSGIKRLGRVQVHVLTYRGCDSHGLCYALQQALLAGGRAVTWVSQQLARLVGSAWGCRCRSSPFTTLPPPTDSHLHNFRIGPPWRHSRPRRGPHEQLCGSGPPAEAARLVGWSICPGLHGRRRRCLPQSSTLILPTQRPHVCASRTIFTSSREDHFPYPSFYSQFNTRS